jgi:hypothetical protein
MVVREEEEASMEVRAVLQEEIIVAVVVEDLHIFRVL